MNLYFDSDPLVILTQVAIHPQARETLSGTKPYLMPGILSVPSPLEAYQPACGTSSGGDSLWTSKTIRKFCYDCVCVGGGGGGKCLLRHKVQHIQKLLRSKIAGLLLEGE